MPKALIRLGFLLLASTPSFAQSEPSSSDLKQFVQSATQVLRVSVLAGDAEGYGEGVYKARIKEVFKGNSKSGDVIFFGRFVGESIGTDYVLFLAPARTMEASGIFGPVSSWQVMREGYGQQEIGYSCGFQSHQHIDCRDSIRVCTDYVRLPKTISISSDGDRSAAFGCKWFDAKDYTNELRAITFPR